MLALFTKNNARVKLGLGGGGDSDKKKHGVLRETFCKTTHLHIGTRQSIRYAPQTTHSLIYQSPESMAAYYFLPEFFINCSLFMTSFYMATHLIDATGQLSTH